MCQLLGMNCNVPTDICFSFQGFRSRGGGTDEHRDGWGIAFFEDKGCRIFLDIAASVDSPVADLVKHFPIHSKNVVAHIRRATVGRVALENTHPFIRELWGRYWIFAHNGDLHDFAPTLGGRYRPVGDTDSELAFCHILEQLCASFPDSPQVPQLFRAIEELTASIRKHGTFNFLLSNGDFLICHCSTQLHYLVRKTPFRTAHLIDDDITIDFSTVTRPSDRVAVIATTPLTDNEVWTKISPNQLIAFVDGEPRYFST